MYDFENKDKIPFKDLTGEQMKIVVNAEFNSIETTALDGGYCRKANDQFYPDSVYRVKSEPYSLEDALSDAASICARRPSQVTTKENAEYMNIIRKLSASLEASK